MRKGIALILAICIAVCLAGCSKSYSYTPQENIHFNYNNISADNSTFWLTEDSCYCPGSPLYFLYYYCINQSGRKMIESAGNAAFAVIQAYDNMVYMLDWTDDSTYKLHSYNTETGKHQDLIRLREGRSFFVVGENLYYFQEHDNGVDMVQSLWVYSLTDGTSTAIASHVLDAGVMDGIPTYVTQNKDTVSIYAYDPNGDQSTLTGSFSCSLKHNEYVTDYVNFTDDQVIVTVLSDSSSRILCYHCESGQLSEYQIDGWLSSVIAYQEYAFVIKTYNTQSHDSDDWDNTIYRVSLKDGSMDEIGSAKGLIDTFVASDDCVYAASYTDWDHIYRYDSDGNKTLVCNW